ncbi:MAG: hypothetical protein ACLFTT_02865 [Candidatus Hydrogenedentota bacterium]
MGECRWISHVDALFDNEAASQHNELAAHVAACPACADYLAHLETLRTAAGTVTEATPQIADNQFPAFMNGVREGIEARQQGLRPLWAALSLVAAALVIATSLFVLFAAPDQATPVEAGNVQVESAHSELEGATVDVQVSEEGNATVWVRVNPQDVWWE